MRDGVKKGGYEDVLDLGFHEGLVGRVNLCLLEDTAGRNYEQQTPCLDSLAQFSQCTSPIGHSERLLEYV
jgi:hypothetical protein